MAKHEHGSMNIDEQVKTYNGFIKASAYVIVICIAVLIFLAIVGT